MRTNRTITGYANGGALKGDATPVINISNFNIGAMEVNANGSFGNITVDGSTVYVYRVEQFKTSSHPYYRQIAYGKAADAIFTRVSTNLSGTSWGPWTRLVVKGLSLIWTGWAKEITLDVSSYDCLLIVCGGVNSTISVMATIYKWMSWREMTYAITTNISTLNDTFTAINYNIVTSGTQTAYKLKTAATGVKTDASTTNYSGGMMAIVYGLKL